MIKRIYHTWDVWECYKSGFYEKVPPKGMTKDDCEETYRDLLSDTTRFKKASFRVISEWKNSCEHYLTNENMNRIAWMGQASLCIECGIPSIFRGGYHLLSKQQQIEADNIALEAINAWMFFNCYPLYSMESIESKTEANLY